MRLPGIQFDTVQEFQEVADVEDCVIVSKYHPFVCAGKVPGMQGLT